MAKNVSLLTLCLFFCACMAQIDVKLFIEDPIVQEIIEKSKGKVILDWDSDLGLAAGNEEITGLDPLKYYMVEELGANDQVVRFSFVREKGDIWALSGIGKPSGGKVTGLTNGTVYRVTSATPLFADDDALSYFELEPNSRLPAATKTVTVSDGAITLPGPQERYCLNLADAVSATKNYGIMMVPDVLQWGNSRTSAYYNLQTISTITQIDTQVSNNFYEKCDPGKDIGIYQFPQPVNPAYLGGMSIINLPGKNTQADYLIIEYDESGDFITRFAYISAVIEDEPAIPGAQLDIAIAYTSDDAPQVTSSTTTYTQNDNTPIILSVANAADYDAIAWFVDGAAAGTGANYTLNTASIDFKMAGNYTITVEASKDGVPHTTHITVTVTIP